MESIRSFKYVFEMQIRRNSGWFGLFALLQAMISLGMVVGFTFMIPDIDEHSILYLATGAPTFILITTGLVILPQQIGTGKSEGYHDFTRSWPVKRSIILLADSAIWVVLSLPAVTASAIITHFCYNASYSVSWTIIPVLLLISLTSIGVGYGYAYIFSPNTSLIISQIVIFGALMFSPINYPMERLPEWLQSFHNYLPFFSMAEVMRSSLASGTFSASISNYFILTIWFIVGYGSAIHILNKKE